MALPPKQIGTFLPSEISFLAENTKVTIIPRQALDSVDLIGLKLPSMRPMRRVEVPLWVAIILKKQSRCNIVSPAWLSEDNLKKAYEAEASNMTRFSDKLPWEWIEVGELVLESAPDDLSSAPHVIRNLLRDIREIRQAKVRAGLRGLEYTYMQLDHIGAMELNEIRPFVTMTMNELRILQNSVENEEEQAAEGMLPDDVDDGSDMDDTFETREYSAPPRNSSHFDDSVGSRLSRPPAPSYDDDGEDDDDELEMDESYLHTINR
ncbi:hypothetical protein BZA70DRAFT_278968 [Myxozyma melibiosi]|uniref:DNA replication complex GINS protein PSF2 n=1 Tax=Myxozyma melibiosi TaxID=54550 RepID=A0ABR1F5E6_9ASCO